MVSIEGGEMIQFHFQSFNKNLRKAYPGYDMFVSANLGALRFVFVNRMLQELATYFGAFAKMREVINAAAAYYYSASVQAVQQTAATSRIKMSFTVANPQVVVPLTSTSSDSAVLDLGKITVENEFEDRQNGLSFDKITVTIDSLNMITNQNNTMRPLVERTGLRAIVSRTISDNIEHTVPDVSVRIYQIYKKPLFID